VQHGVGQRPSASRESAAKCCRACAPEATGVGPIGRTLSRCLGAPTASSLSLVTATEHRLVTDRLVLRRWQAEDVRPYAALCSDPEVMRWIEDGRTPTFEESRRAIEGFERSWAQHGVGLFALEEKVSAELIGFCGTLDTELPSRNPPVSRNWLEAGSTRLGKGLCDRGSVRGALVRIQSSRTGKNRQYPSARKCRLRPNHAKARDASRARNGPPVQQEAASRLRDQSCRLEADPILVGITWPCSNLARLE
jgi:Acetyltransferase (GNAT) domain